MAQADNGSALGGLVVLGVMVVLLYSCFSGEDEAPAPSKVEVAAPAEPPAPLSAEQQKQAEDFVKFTINSNGYLCAKITDVKPAGGANLFAIQCIENRNGTGSAVYLYDGDTKKVSRL